MNTRKICIILIDTLAITCVITGSKASATGVPADYRVPLIGSYKITRLDNIANSSCGHDGQGRYMDLNGWGGTNTDEGDPINASGPGTITVEPYDAAGYGNSVLLESNGVTFRYAHLDKVYVHSGDQVFQGDLIGLLGKSGMGGYQGEHYAHLHWEAWLTAGGEFNIFDIPGVDEDDTACSGDQFDGYIYGPSLPSNPYADCKAYAAAFQNDPHVALFDDDLCQGNPHRLYGLPGYQLIYNLNGSTDYNDRVRSMYIPSGWSVVVGAHVDDNPYQLTQCFTSSQDDLDPVQYSNTNPQGQSVWIGYNPTAGTNPTNPDGYDMISYAAVSLSPECFDPTTAVSSYSIGQGGPAGNPDWLLEFSKAEVPPLEVVFHIKVDAQAGVFDAFRLVVDGNILFETSADEYYYQWNTFGWSEGLHTLTIQYRRLSDGGNWGNAQTYSEQYYLSPNRNGTAPCDGGNGMQLTSGSVCIRLTQSFDHLDSIGWSDRSGLVAQVIGNNDAISYDSVDFQGPGQIIRSGESRTLGGNVSSIELRQPITGGYVPESPLGIDQNTVAYITMDEGSGSTVASSVGNLAGSLMGGASFAQGRFNTAVNVPSQPDTSGVDFPAVDFGRPLTIELFVSMNSIGGDQRIATQIGGGSSKWLIRAVGNRISVWACHNYGCHEAYSLTDIQTNRWYYIMLTYDGNKTAKFYLDSILQATINMDFVMSLGATNFDVGQGEHIYNCNCVIDEIRISNIARIPLGPPVPTPSPQPSPTYIPTPTNTDLPTATLTATRYPTSSPTATITPTPSSTNTVTSTATPTKTSTPSSTPTQRLIPTKTPKLTSTTRPTSTPKPTRTPRR